MLGLWNVKDLYKNTDRFAMPVCRTILRIDFPPAFEILDRLGTLAKLIHQGAPDEAFFAQIGEGSPVREVRAWYHDKLMKRDFRVGPTYLMIDYQNLDGSPLDRLREDSSFSAMTSLIPSIRQEFGIKSELRIGLRLFYLSKIAANKGALVDVFKLMMDDKVTSIFEEEIDSTTDAGLSLAGGSDGAQQYSVRFGPFLGIGEAAKYFDMNGVTSSVEIFDTADFICDLDMFQTKTKFGVELQWWKNPLRTASKVIPRVEDYVRNRRK